MMKFFSILKSRGYICGQLVNKNISTQNVNRLYSVLSSSGVSIAGQKGWKGANDRVFAEYCVCEGKVALYAKPVPPTFAKAKNGIAVKRQGIVLLTFTPSVAEEIYDWGRKQVFGLSATEVGSLISLGPRGLCEFFHDPGMKSGTAGEVRKNLSIISHADGSGPSGYIFSLTVVNNTTKTNECLTVPVTSDEFAVMRTSFSFALPHILGWDRYLCQQPKLEEN